MASKYKEGRIRALKAVCPECGALKGRSCAGKYGLRKSPHRARLTANPYIPPSPAVQDANAFYYGDPWRRLRYKVLKELGGICQCCGSAPSRGKPLHVDHIKPRSRFPELELERSNLQVLCSDCNLGKGAWDDTDWREVAS